MGCHPTASGGSSDQNIAPAWMLARSWAAQGRAAREPPLLSSEDAVGGFRAELFHRQTKGESLSAGQGCGGACAWTPRLSQRELPFPSGRHPAQAHTYDLDFLAFDTGKGPEKDKT